LELDGVFESWAVPKGPSLEPGRPRTAIAVEDHPLDYGDFEGTIPEGEYGAGTVLIGDRGYWAPVGNSSARGGLGRGSLEFVMEGERLHGAWILKRQPAEGSNSRTTWRLTKQQNGTERARKDADNDDRSVASGRTMAQIAAGEDPGPKPFIVKGSKAAAANEVWRSNRDSGPQRASKMARTSAYRQRRRSATHPVLPRFIPPQLAKLVEEPPKGAGRVHEVKLDGYRMHVRLHDGKARLLTRNGYDWTAKYQTTAKAAQRLPAESAYIDGELCAVRADGTTSFDELTAARDAGRTSKLVYFAFDLLHVDGEDLTAHALEERKRRLAKLLEGAPPAIEYLEHFSAMGDEVFMAACRLGVEGVVSKRLNAPYRSNASETWQKAKCFRRDESSALALQTRKARVPALARCSWVAIWTMAVSPMPVVLEKAFVMPSCAGCEASSTGCYARRRHWTCCRQRPAASDHRWIWRRSTGSNRSWSRRSDIL
jgi:bifunctional non-homologous end joining protein LigD